MNLQITLNLITLLIVIISITYSVISNKKKDRTISHHDKNNKWLNNELNSLQDNFKNVITTFKSESPIRTSLKNSDNNLNMNTE